MSADPPTHSQQGTAHTCDPPTAVAVDTPGHIAISILEPESSEPCPPPTQGWLSRLVSLWKSGFTRLTSRLSSLVWSSLKPKTPVLDLESGLSNEARDMGNDKSTATIPCAPLPSQPAGDLPEDANLTNAPNGQVSVQAVCAPHVSSPQIDTLPATALTPPPALSAFRPSRFVEHLPEHPHFDRVFVQSIHESSPGSSTRGTAPRVEKPTAKSPASRCQLGKACAHSGHPHTHSQPVGLTAKYDFGSIVSDFLNERARIRMHQQAADRIKMPALRPLSARSSMPVVAVPLDFSPGTRHRRAHTIDIPNSKGAYTLPRRFSGHYGRYESGADPGFKEWVERARSGRSKIAPAGPSLALPGLWSGKVPWSPPSSPESPGPVTPISEFVGAIGTSGNKKSEDEPGSAALAYGNRCEVGGGDGGAAL
ncbi:hypothetical protein FRC08_008334 [Ceratobasidium sp. 394]|nr:hypothetical protein FRC08_008334 [Ceratobasidium sp. 394]KAG9100053.1 hypothetical protein FS749_016398 [Ceratobasidium sp. UAMH 11750]